MKRSRKSDDEDDDQRQFEQESRPNTTTKTDENDTSDPHSITQPATPSLLGIPPESRLEIMSYVFKTGATIHMSKEKLSSDARFWQNEVLRLQGKRVRRKMRSGETRVLRACRELYLCGIKALWGSNTYAFDTMESLSDFLGEARSEVKESIKSVALGERYFTDVYGRYKVPFDENWPPSLQGLKQLPSLEHLTLYIGPDGETAIKDVRTLIVDHDALHALGGPRSTGNVEVCDEIMRHLPEEAKARVRNGTAPNFVREWIVLSIPESTFERLKSLKMMTLEMWDMEWREKEWLKKAREMMENGSKVFEPPWEET